MTIKNTSSSAATRPNLAILAVIALACIGAAPQVLAVTNVTPYATVGVQTDSNVFARPDNQPPFAATGNTELGDTISEYLAGVIVDFGWGLDDLKLDAEGRRFNYSRFTQLDHNDYKFGGNFTWHLGPVVDGSLVYEQSHIMEPLADTFSEQLEQQTDRKATGTARILITPEWRFELQPSWHELDSPLPQYPGFGLHETAGAAALDYLGISKLVAGLRVRYTDGSFHQILGATRYHQTTAELTADYAVTGLSSFTGALGYTLRDSSLVNPADAAIIGNQGGIIGRTSAVIGSLGLRRQLSVKTHVTLTLFREVDSYIAGANPEIGTGADLALGWEPDVKFSVALHYRLETQSIQGGLVIANGFVDRTDHPRSAQLEVKYHITRWLTLRPYYSREERTSNFAEANYTSNTVGIDLSARFE
jgi:hypothetical protein